MVWQRLAAPCWEGALKALVEEHARETQARFAQALLADWAHEVRHFWQVVSKEMLSRLPELLNARAGARRGSSTRSWKVNNAADSQASDGQGELLKRNR